MVRNKLPILKKTSDFTRIKKTGKKIFVERWIIINYIHSEEVQSRFGWTISRRVGSAVVRNKLKRWCRVYFKSAKAKFIKTYDLNVIFREINDKEFYRELKFSNFKETMDFGIAKLK